MAVSVKCLAVALAGLMLGACAGGAKSPDANFPGVVWVTADAMNPRGHDALDLAVSRLPTQSMIVVKDGAVVYSYGDIARTEGTYLASVRKSILSMMYGDAVAAGVIDLDASLADLGVDDVGGLTDTEKSATVRDLISARSGIYHPASNDSGVTEEGPARGDHRPGTYYWYNNWDFNAAGGVYELAIGANIYDAFNRLLARPLEMQDFDLAAHLENGKGGDLTKSRFPAYHFYLSTRDAARLGVLMLNHGRWGGAQIIPADWVAQSVSKITPNAEMNPPAYRDSGFAYGYMWWVFDPKHFPPAFDGAYIARGHFGQYILVLPASGVVIAHKTLPASYETPEEYEAVNVTWDEFRTLVDLALAALERG
ncbi:MAG: serine hydrolase [Parvularculaceae bacterium]|nr:serine hydrolase [Parvularculaceae bacterium]